MRKTFREAHVALEGVIDRRRSELRRRALDAGRKRYRTCSVTVA
jgi:hypothetical protein